jgi:eukaryotic-like serine/threonine-protein kinase
VGSNPLDVVVIGIRVNNYELVSLVGEGGMGSVYLARHVTIGRSAAVKVMRPEFAGDPSLVARFVNEARAAAAVGHPGIVDVIDVGVLVGTKLPYLMMEYLPGENLHARLDRVGRLPVPQAVDIVLQAVEALGAAHARGLVHRDLKPDNLFLVPNSRGREIVKVLDFGIAKLRPDHDESGVKTRTGIVLGTPLYMSPEQCRGLRNEVDQRTDIYALGLILFEMLCGRTPFQAESSMDVMMMHASSPPPAPRSLNPDIPPALELVIFKALAKRREDRFASMADFSAAIAAAMATPPRPARRWVVVAATAAAVVASLALGRMVTRRLNAVKTPPPAVEPPVVKTAPVVKPVVEMTPAPPAVKTESPPAAAVPPPAPKHARRTRPPKSPRPEEPKKPAPAAAKKW